LNLSLMLNFRLKPTSYGRLRDWVLLVCCNLMWASQLTMVKLVQEQMGPVFATFLPMTLATLLLIPLVGVRQRPPDSRRIINWRDVFDFILIGVFGQVVAQLFITWGVQLSLASNAALVLLALPVAIAVMAHFLLGEQMTPIRWLSFGLAIAGVLECSGINWRELNFLSKKFFVGNLLIFLSLNGSAFYTVYCKKLLAKYSPLKVLLYSYYAVFAFLLPITVYTEPGAFRIIFHYTERVWIGLVILTLFQYFLSMVIFLNVLTRLSATQVGVSNYLIPFLGLVIAAIVLHEHLTKFMVVGGILVLMSTMLITVFEDAKRHDESTEMVDVDRA